MVEAGHGTQRGAHRRFTGPTLIARLLIWNLYDSKTSLAELRDRLPELPEGSLWVSNESQERFGLLVIGDEDLPDLGDVPHLIGVDPVIAEEFDVE